MKKTFAALAVIILFIGCASNPPAAYNSIVPDTTPTKFEGSWGHLSPDSENNNITFSGNSFVKKWDTGSISGLFSFDENKILFLTEDGRQWSTAYTLKNIELNLLEGSDGWNWYGAFYKNVKKVFKEDDTADVDFVMAKKLRDAAAALFFYDIDNNGELDSGLNNIIQGQNELGGVCSDYAMELARLAEQEGFENYVAMSGDPSYSAIAKVVAWFDTGTYSFRVREGKDFGTNNMMDGHYDGVYRDADWSKIKPYDNNPPYTYGFPPFNHAWNIVIINNRIFVIDATQYDEWGNSGNNVHIIEVMEGIQ